MQQFIKGIVDTQKASNVSLGNTNAGDDTLIELTIKSNDVLLEYTNPTFQLLSKKSDNTKVRQIENIILEEGIIKIKCDTQTVLCQGLVTNQLYIVDGERISTVYFYFMVNPSLENEILEESKDKIESLDKLDELLNVSFTSLDEYEQRLNEFGVTMNTAEVEEEKRKTNELLRLSTEKARILTEENRTANELSRLDNENVRTLNEETRVLTEEDRITNENNRRIAENTRIIQENTRVAAEGQRQSIFETNESIRNEQEIKRLKSEATRETKINTWEEREGLRLVSEAQRREAEEGRVLTENERVAAENIRKEQETNRELTYNKFNAAELERVTNEVTRGNNEEARNTAELLREQQETERIAAELTRNNRYDEAEVTRNTNYNSSENTRQLSYQNSENTRNETFAAEELKRTNSYQDTENTRNNAFNQQESNRQSQYTAAERIRVENENLRKDNESNRVTSEEVRKSNEILRTSSESERVAAENIRITKESDRVSKENIRIANEDTRVSNENIRKANETDRVSKENIRVTNETARINAEATRGTKETARINAETVRAAAEVTRVNSENTRVTNENTRTANETNRVNAENIRIANEAARQTVYKEVEENRKGYDNKVYPNMYEARKADYEILDNKFGDFTHSKFSGVGNFKADNTKEGLIKDFNIKGRTLQNLCKLEIAWRINGTELKPGENAVNKFIPNLFKPNTKYTCIWNKKSIFKSINLFTDSNSFINGSSIFTDAIFTFTTKESFTEAVLPHIYKKDEIAPLTSSDFNDVYITILEGDYTNTPLSQLPYVDGIKSLGENENKVILKSCGKNLFNVNGNLTRSPGTFTDNNYTAYDGNYINAIANVSSRFAVGQQIRIKYGSNYTLKFKTKQTTDGINSTLIVGGLLDYDEMKQSLIQQSSSSASTFTEYTINLNSVKYNYLLIMFGKVGVGTAPAQFYDVQLEENTIATSYEPYKEDKIEYLLDEPLRSLPNGIIDEIVDNKLIRRVGKVVFNGSENWILSTVGSNINYSRFYSDIIPNTNSVYLVISNNFSYNLYDTLVNNENEGITTYNQRINIKVSKTKLVTPDVQGFKTWLQANPTTVYYELATPTITDISNKTLKAYEGTTNVFMDNLLVGEISAKVPTDLTSEIEANRRDFKGNVYPNMYEARIRDTSYLLDKINNAEYLEYTGTNITANNSYDGLVKNLSIKGRTLQNLLPPIGNKWTTANVELDLANNSCKLIQNQSNEQLFTQGLKLKSNNVYTFIYEVTASTITNTLFINGSSENTTYILSSNLNIPSKIGINKVLLTTTSGLNDSSGFKIVIGSAEPDGNYIILKDLLLLEGDYTNTPLSELPYIDGIKSVGELESKVTVKSCGKNLFDKNKVIDNKYQNYDINNNIFVVSSLQTSMITDLIKIKPNTTYTKQYIGAGVFYTKEKMPITNVIANTDTFTTPSNAEYVNLNIIKTKIEQDINKGVLEENTVATTYEPYQETKQELILTEPLRSLPNGVCDEIIGDKLIRRVGKIIFDGSSDENWNLLTNFNSGTALPFEIQIRTTAYTPSISALMCNLFVSNKVYLNPTSEGIYMQYLYVNIAILPSKLSQPNVTGFKTWLSQNPVTLYYQLETPIIETISPLILQSFDATTHITSDNYLLPKITAKVPSNVQAVVTNLMSENEELNNTVSLMSLESEENNLSNIETSLEQDARLTVLELGL